MEQGTSSPDQDLALKQRRQEIYDALGMEQVVDDIGFARRYLLYMHAPSRGFNSTQAILDDLNEPEEYQENDLRSRKALHEFRRHLITIDESAAYDDIPITKDPFARDFAEAFKQTTGPEQEKALQILQKIYRLSLLNSSINATPENLIPTFIQQIVDPLPPRPHLRIVE